jgi:hypothetical protein
MKVLCKQYIFVFGVQRTNRMEWIIRKWGVCNGVVTRGTRIANGAENSEGVVLR